MQSSFGANGKHKLTPFYPGYAARVALSSNPWNQSAFETQICAIILAPTLICISIYLTIKHLTLALNPSLSRVRPRLYPFIFVPADVSCLLVQAIGGSLAASAGRTNAKLLQDGNRAIIAGICLQVVVLLAFGVLCLDYFLRVKKWIHSAEVTPEAKALWEDKKFGLFGCAILGAYGCILIRCVYRVAEMAGGWGNYIMQDEPSFAVLDSAMVLIASMLLACFAPGIFFPQMSRRAKLSYGGKREKKSDTAVNTGDEREEDLEQGGLKVEEETREPSAAPSS